MRLMPTSPHTRPMSFPATPEQLEQQAADMVAAAEVVTDICFPVDRVEMEFATKVAASLGFTLLWPSTARPVSAVPSHIWHEAVRMSNEAKLMRAARAARHAL